MGIASHIMSLPEFILLLLCNLAGAYLLHPTYARPVVCLSELRPGNTTDKTLCW